MKVSRRNFIQKSAATAGIASFGGFNMINGTPAQDLKKDRLPREVWIASLSQSRLNAETPEEMAEKILDTLEGIKIYQPDIICLPETFPFYNVSKRYSIEEQIRTSENILPLFADYAQKNDCYLICPVYTSENGRYYNSAVIFNRKGERMGEYRKARATEGEMEKGIFPGPIKPPVFKTDFGIIGVQICFDVLWDESWKSLREQGAEIVFFPSAFAAGQMVNAKAWQNKYVVVSSTVKNTTKICDITGEEIAKTGIWEPNLICAPVNLDKIFLHLWPYVNRFPEIRRKYGRKIKITLYHEEEWAILENLSHDINLEDIIQEFEIRTHEDHTRSATIKQAQIRE